jgi:hypothetical protein
MLVIEPAVRAAHARRDLHAGMRYAVVRLAELLDPDTPFALSGCAYCDPLAAVGAFEAAARDHLANPGVRHGTVLAASQLLSDVVEQEGNLRSWYPGDTMRLLLFLAQLRKVPTVKTVGERQTKVPYHERTTWVRQKLRALVDGSLARFRAALEDPATGYRARLLDGIGGRLHREPATEREWAELDHDLSCAAALALEEGRDGRELARAIGAAVVAAEDAAAGAVALVDQLRRPAAQYEVVTVLTGARSLSGTSARAFGVQVLGRPAPRWPAGGTAPARRALADFLLDRVPADDGVALVARVVAWDREHARVSAIAVAEGVRDHLVAQHPQGRFAIGAEALVLDVAAGTARRAGATPAALREAQPLPSDSAGELMPVLRANALARGESSPVLRILHAWVALEYLAKENGQGASGDGPADSGANGAGGRSDPPAYRPRLEAYLPPHLASVVALSGLRAQLLTGWREVRALALRSDRRDAWLEVETWVGAAGGRPRSLGRLVTLLRALHEPATSIPARLAADAPAAVAAAFLLDRAGAVGPFARRRLEALGRQFDHGSRLAKAAEAIQVRALIAIARLKLARHLALHQGFNAAQASPPLALSAMHVLSAAFEVLQRWIEPGDRTWDALCEARRWHERNLAGWRETVDPQVDADHLLHPRRV